MSDSGRNQAVIGAFVVGAVVLAVVGVIVFGGGKLFKKADHFVMFFEGSVKGLTIGAPVTFRGVKVGSVVDITLRANPMTLDVRIPVVIEIEKNRIERTVDMPERGPDSVKRLIEKGLRAKLDIQSMVTGQLLVNLEFLPEEPARLSGVKHRYMEIPTIPSTFERLAKKLEDLPISDIVNKASASLTSLEQILGNPALVEMINHLNQASTNIHLLTADLNQQVPPLIDSFQRIADHADQLVLNVNDRVQPLADDAEQALNGVNTAAGHIGHAADGITELASGAQPAVDQAGRALANVADLTAANSKERAELRNTLKELSEAARSIRVWSSYLERHPEALITGKGGSKRR
jgi:paraquat-inducible protein B